MCWLCDANDGEGTNCPACLVPICFDAEADDDDPVLAVTIKSGEIYCMYHCHLHEPLDDDD